VYFNTFCIIFPPHVSRARTISIKTHLYRKWVRVVTKGPGVNDTQSFCSAAVPGGLVLIFIKNYYYLSFRKKKVVNFPGDLNFFRPRGLCRGGGGWNGLTIINNIRTRSAVGFTRLIMGVFDEPLFPQSFRKSIYRRYNFDVRNRQRVKRTHRQCRITVAAHT